MSGQVVIATNLKKTKEMFDKFGNQIDPVTHAIIKPADKPEVIGNLLPDDEFNEMGRNAGIKNVERKSQININGVTYIRFQD